MEKNKKPTNISEEITNLVVARLETIPSNVEISIGGDGNFTIKELIERVKKQDEIGKKMIDMQLAYLRSLSQFPTAGTQNAFSSN